jgi:hypothetical protein
LGVLLYCGISNGQTAPSGDTETFQLHAVAPPTPALKYQFMVDPVDYVPGNAALAYTQAVLLLDKDAAADIGTALVAGDDHFDAIAQSIYTKNERVFAALDQAGRCEGCDWQVYTGRDQAQVNLTQLRAVHMLANLVQIRAKQQIRAGKVDDAIAMLRLGYELSNRTEQRPLFISAVVSFTMTSAMEDRTAELMKRPDSPNLYWALVNLPHPASELRIALAGERKSALTHGIDGVPTTPAEMSKMYQDASQDKDFVQFVNDAQAYYAGTRDMSLDAVKRLDPAMVFDTYGYETYSRNFDDWYKLMGLPFRQMMARQQALDKAIAANPGRWQVPPRIRQMETEGRLERRTAALTTVEAIRSYAAANGGKLPAHLDDITDTPAPNNPMTDEPFDYHVDGGVAILSDPQSQIDPLTYTISIRQ